jgi:PAS domain S-box-containing protein
MVAHARRGFASAAVLTFLSLPWLCPTASAQPRSPKTVLTVHWSSEYFPTNPLVDDAIREVLRSGSATPVDYFAEYLESDRFPEETASLALRDYIRQKYRGRRIDLVFAVSEVALTFVLRYRDELFAGAPIVFSGSAMPDDRVARTAQLTGVVSSSTAYDETLELALTLHPSTERVFVVAYAPTGEFLDGVQRELGAFEHRVQLTYLTGLPVARLLEAVEDVPPRSLILFIRYSQEDPGHVLFPSDVARLVAQASPVPVYGISETSLGTGLVGGAMYSAREVGARLGTLGQQILQGTRPDPPIERIRTVPMFDWRQVERWDISPSKLPPHSDIRFREPSAWDRYRWYIVGAIAFAVLQTLMIAALVIERSRRHQAQTRYALATTAGGVGVWDWNLETDEIYVDASITSMLGYADSGVNYHLDHFCRLIHPDDAPVFKARTREVADGARPSYEMEFRMVHRDSGVRWFLSRGSYLRRNGRAAHLTGTYTDITERKMSERALAEMQAELTRVSRLTALGEFAASLAHEVRQPLTSIVINAKASLRWLGEVTPNLTEIRGALLDVVDAGNWASELIKRNRELFKHHTVKKEPLDIHDVVRDVAVLVQARLQDCRVALTTSFASGLPLVNGDRIELQQVLLNLIVNGIEATQGVDPGARRIEVSSTLLPTGLAKICVKDNGVGLDGVDMHKMFSLSYTTKPHGTGIGLSLSRSIVEAHGGRLWAEPNLNAGATFSFTVPVYGTANDDSNQGSRAPGVGTSTVQVLH